MSSLNSPCAACKCLRRKCPPECVFAPYFPADLPQKFANVHKVFGASNISKLLNDLSVGQREDAVSSLAYEAEYRLRDPVYGCVGLISLLRHKLDQVQSDLVIAKKELSTFVGPSALLPVLHHGGSPYPNAAPFNISLQNAPFHGGSAPMIRDPQQLNQQQMMEAQQQAALVAREELMRRCEGASSQENEFMRFNSAAGLEGGGGGYSQMATIGAMSPSLGLAPYEQQDLYQIQQLQLHEQMQAAGHLRFTSQLLPQQVPHAQTAHRPGSDQRNNGVRLPC